MLATQALKPEFRTQHPYRDFGIVLHMSAIPAPERQKDPGSLLACQSSWHSEFQAQWEILSQKDTVKWHWERHLMLNSYSTQACTPHTLTPTHTFAHAQQKKREREKKKELWVPQSGAVRKLSAVTDKDVWQRWLLKPSDLATLPEKHNF